MGEGRGGGEFVIYLIAGLRDKIPTDRYIDGIDQSSFLLADDGESNRKTVYMYVKSKFTVLRWQEYKYHRYIVEVGDGEYTATGSIQNSKLVEAAYGLSYNLYLDPKERKPIGIRKLWTVPFFSQEAGRHMKTFVKYPPKKPQIVMPGNYPIIIGLEKKANAALNSLRA